MALSHCRVVLVQPQIAANIGATARVMRNLGFRHLVLAAPQADHLAPEALRTATHGELLLRQARVTKDFESSVADCVLVVGASARTGGIYRKQSAGPSEEMLRRLMPAIADDRPVALVFGPERTGLTNEQIVRCHYLLHLATDDDYPAMNLSHAVAVCLYQLRQLWLDSSTKVPRKSPADDPATYREQSFLFEQLELALEQIHFLYGPKADSLMHAVRHLLGRAELTKMETKVLMGMAQQIRWYAANRSETSET